MSDCMDVGGDTHLIHFLLPLSRHGCTGGVSSVGDGVEDFRRGAARLVDLRRVPPRQNLSQGCRYHAALVAGDPDQVASERLELEGRGRSRGLQELLRKACTVTSEALLYRRQRAGVRGRVQQNIVSRVDQHLKHLKRHTNKTFGPRVGSRDSSRSVRFPLGYLAEPLLAPCGHTHVHLAVLGGVSGGRRVVEALLHALHPCQQLRYSKQEEIRLQTSGRSRFRSRLSTFLPCYVLPIHRYFLLLRNNWTL